MLAAEEVEQIGDFIAGIDEDGVVRLLASEDESILEKGSNGACFDDHEPV